MKVTLLKSSFIAMLAAWLAMWATPTYADNPVTIYKALDQPQTTNQLPIAFDIIFNANPNLPVLPQHIVISGTAKVESFVVTGNARWWKLIITKVISPGTIKPIIPANVIGDNRISAISPDDIVTYKVNPTPKPTKKYHPGHYVLVNPLDDLEIATRSLNIMGVQKRYYWRTLEPALDQYDFSSIRADLEYAREHNLQLIPFIIDKTFRVNQPTPLPDYVINDYNGEFHYIDSANNIDIRMAKRWKLNVEGRYLALIRALGAAFDADPNIEGINLQETAAEGVEVDLTSEYDPIAYHANLIERINVAGQAFPTTRVHLMINGFPRATAGDPYRTVVFVRTMATAIMRVDGVYSGPDILPFSTDLNSPFGVYPVYADLANLMITGCSAQLDSFNHKYPKDYPNTAGLYITDPFKDGASMAGEWLPMQRIFDFGVDTLKLEYFIWREVDPTKDPTQVDTHFKFVPDALSVIINPANAARFPGLILHQNYLPLITK